MQVPQPASVSEPGRRSVLSRPGREGRLWLPVSLQTAGVGSSWKVLRLHQPHRSGHSDVLGARAGPQEQAPTDIVGTTGDSPWLGKVVTQFLSPGFTGQVDREMHGLLGERRPPRDVTSKQDSQALGNNRSGDPLCSPVASLGDLLQILQPLWSSVPGVAS